MSTYQKEYNDRIKKKPRNAMAYGIIEAALENDLTVLSDAVREDASSINMQDATYGYTALHIAAGLGNLSMVQFLLDQPALVWGQKDRSGRDALDVAIEAGHPTIISTLMRHRASMLGAPSSSLSGKGPHPTPSPKSV